MAEIGRHNCSKCDVGLHLSEGRWHLHRTPDINTCGPSFHALSALEWRRSHCHGGVLVAEYVETWSWPPIDAISAVGGSLAIGSMEIVDMGGTPLPSGVVRQQQPTLAVSKRPVAILLRWDVKALSKERHYLVTELPRPRLKADCVKSSSLTSHYHRSLGILY